MVLKYYRSNTVILNCYSNSNLFRAPSDIKDEELVSIPGGNQTVQILYCCLENNILQDLKC